MDEILFEEYRVNALYRSTGNYVDLNRIKKQLTKNAKIIFK